MHWQAGSLPLIPPGKPTSFHSRNSKSLFLRPLHLQCIPSSLFSTGDNLRFKIYWAEQVVRNYWSVKSGPGQHAGDLQVLWERSQDVDGPLSVMLKQNTPSPKLQRLNKSDSWAERGSWRGHADKGGAGPQAAEHGDKGDPERTESKGRANAWGPGMGQWPNGPMGARRRGRICRTLRGLAAAARAFINVMDIWPSIRGKQIAWTWYEPFPVSTREPSNAFESGKW